MSRLSRFLNPPPAPDLEVRRPTRASPTIGVGLDAVAQFIRSTSHGRLTGTEFADLEAVLESNPIVFAAFRKRMDLLKQGRFQWQRVEAGTPGGFWGNPELRILERPWPGGTTADLFKLIELDVTRTGIAAIRRSGDRLDFLDPYKIHAVTETISDRPGAKPFVERFVAWVYVPDVGGRPIVFHPDERELTVIAPIPDPRRRHAGMSWIRPALYDVRGDDMLTRHRLSYFENAASPNLVLKSQKSLSDEQFEELREHFSSRHEGISNAYRTLILEGGADVETVGSNMNEARFVDVQDAVENRISVASGVPAPLLGVKIGSSPTYNNMGTARREFVDTYARPQWAEICQGLEWIVVPPSGSRLWYADAHISALQQDADDAASIRQKDASTIRALVDGGFSPESVVKAIEADDLTLLDHTGLLSVQLQPAGTVPLPPTSEDSES